MTFRTQTSIPVNSCLDCGARLTTEAEYTAHAGEFPHHRVTLANP